MALVLFKVLYILPLLFISGQALFFQNPFFRFPDPFSKFRNGPKDNDNERSSGFFRKNASTRKYNREWELVLEKIITVIVHAILLPRINKVLMYGATVWRIPKIPFELDGWCHSVLFDIKTSNLKELRLETDTGCSAGGLTVDGNLAFFKLENNLHPFVHLSPNGNLFIFSNNRSILNVCSVSNRNYILETKKVKNVEVLICGGAKQDAFYYAKIQKWFLLKIEKMASPRVVGDMMILSTGDDPNFVPVLNRPNAAEPERFEELAATTIPKMYHSSSVLLPNRNLVAGSNNNDGYKYNVKYPIEPGVEKFSPTYFDPLLAGLRQQIMVEFSDKVINYSERLSMKVRSNELRLNKDDLQVTMYAPAFTTHGISMNQRLVMLNLVDVINNILPGFHRITADAPSSGTFGPPGYYLLYVVYKEVRGHVGSDKVLLSVPICAAASA
ncbi:glyoxal oxidase-related protein [Citrus sinensis]|nr:glyoxal oxidase-related protein [Citrus sinensis]